MYSIFFEGDGYYVMMDGPSGVYYMLVDKDTNIHKHVNNQTFGIVHVEKVTENTVKINGDSVDARLYSTTSKIYAMYDSKHINYLLKKLVSGALKSGHDAARAAGLVFMGQYKFDRIHAYFEDQDCMDLIVNARATGDVYTSTARAIAYPDDPYAEMEISVNLKSAKDGEESSPYKVFDVG